MVTTKQQPAVHPKIDAHQHFWRYSPDEYDWISDSMSILRRNFLPEDLQAEIQHANVTGVVAVQARQSLAETQWLLDLASTNRFIRGVVGWVPLTDPHLSDILLPLTKNQAFKGVRHVLQDESDERYILRDDFNRGIQLLKKWDLVYDILIFERHLPFVLQFVEKHPEQVFALDHIAKPRIRDHVLIPWQQNMRSLAEFQNVYCKLSGMVTEAAPGAWTKEGLQPYFDTVFEAFGPHRILFGSDWPVCLTQISYRKWLSVVQAQIANFTHAEQQSIMGGTAARVYRLTV